MSITPEDQKDMFSECYKQFKLYQVNQSIKTYLKEDYYSNAVSDGQHTFEELYKHRMILFSALCTQLSILYKDDTSLVCWKSKLHSDGTMFPNYFIVGISIDEKTICSYHYQDKWYKYFPSCKELPKAPPWNGNTPNDDLVVIFKRFVFDKKLNDIREED